MPREDPENTFAAAKIVFISDEESQCISVEDRRRRRVAFEKTAKRMLRDSEDSDDVKVGVTELQEQLEISEEAGTPSGKLPSRQFASLARWNAQLKCLVVSRYDAGSESIE